jgi:hypothetical protein
MEIAQQVFTDNVPFLKQYICMEPAKIMSKACALEAVILVAMGNVVNMETMLL